MRLEEKIEVLINKCKNLEKEKNHLEEKLFEFEAEFEKKQEEDMKQKRDNEALKIRIDNILEKISESCNE